jgi:hypothetical protein
VLPDIHLYAVNVVEKNPPDGEDALEWMLLTDLQITSFEEAKEKVEWYCLRWRIEVFHKILKSGLRVEKCRLQSADRLIRYLTIMVLPQNLSITHKVCDGQQQMQSDDCASYLQRC